MSNATFETFLVSGILILIIAIGYLAWSAWRWVDRERDMEKRSLDGIRHEMRLNLQRLLDELRGVADGSVQSEIEELLPDVMVVNSFGTSESGDLGRAAGDEDSHEGRPSFYMGDEVTVLDDEGNPIEPGSGQIGLVARSGRLPPCPRCGNLISAIS